MAASRQSQALVRKLGLSQAIEERLHLLVLHFLYHESDHVPHFAYNAHCDGTCLDDIETLQERLRLNPAQVCREQPSDSFDEAVLDLDDTLVATGEGFKQGVNIVYEGPWGYHPLIVSWPTPVE